MLEPQARCRAADHPGSRAVIADVERDTDRVGAAFAHMHDQALPGEALIGRNWRADDAAFVGLPAVAGQQIGDEGGLGW